MSLREFALPDLGEGLTESELVSWEVQVGDTVELNQILAEVETAKALVQLPSPFAGVVRALLAEPGDSVRVGSAIVAIETDEVGQDAAPIFDVEGTAPQAVQAVPEAVQVANAAMTESGGSVDPAPQAQPATATVEAQPATTTMEAQPAPTGGAESPAGNRTAVLVGYGPKGDTGEAPKRRHRRAEWLAAHQVSAPVQTPPQGPDSAQPESAAPASAAPFSAPPAAVRTPVSGVRRRMAEAMVHSAFTAPHASLTLTVDVTPSLEFVERWRHTPRFSDHSIGILTVAAKACLIALRHTPAINSRWDDLSQEVIEFSGVNLGIAVATDRGLLVPNIRAADALSFIELADAVAGLAAAAREATTTPQQLVDGTFTITNVGVFGVDAGTPILPPGEAAILALGAIRRLPWEHDGEIALRSVMTLTLSFDHRLIDGRQGSEFLTTVGSILGDPGGAMALS